MITYFMENIQVYAMGSLEYVLWNQGYIDLMILQVAHMIIGRWEAHMRIPK